MKLNLAPESDLTRPEMENIKLRLHRVETKEISTVTLGAIANSLLTTRGDIIVRNATVPERLALTVPSAPTINFLGVINGETQPTWKSASSAGGADAHILATDASGYTQVERLGIGAAPSGSYGLDARRNVRILPAEDTGDDSDAVSIALGNAIYPTYIKSHRYVGSYSNGIDLYYTDDSSGASTLGARLSSSGMVAFGALTPAYKMDIRSAGQNTIHLSNATGDAGAYIDSTGDAEVSFAGGALYYYYDSGYYYRAKTTAASGLLTVAGTVVLWGNTGLTAGNSFAITPRVTVNPTGNVKIAGTATRATTEGTNHLDIFDGTAPVGTLANGCSIYSTAGELRVMDAAGNATLISPHDEDGYWIFESKDTVTGRRLRIDVEKMLRAINERFGWDFVKEFASA